MKIRLYNDDGSDYVDYEAATIEEIRVLAKERILQPGWKDGWTEEQ